MRESVRMCASVSLFLLMFLITLPGLTIAQHHEEDFTTKDYCDEASTTLNWNTGDGKIELYPFEVDLTGSIGVTNYAWDVVVEDDYAYVADGFSGLQVTNISNPANPQAPVWCNTPGQAYAVAIAGDYAYVADGHMGIAVIDISNPDAPWMNAHWNYLTHDSVRDVAISGNFAFVANFHDGVFVFDITDPTNLVSSGWSCDTDGTSYGIAVAGDYAYVADGPNGLQVIDITDPRNPTTEHNWNCDLIGYAYDVTVSGNYAYVASYAVGGLEVVDISEPENPTWIAWYDTPGHAVGVAVAGDHAYVGDGGSGLLVIDVSDPMNPEFEYNYDTHGLARGVAVAGQYACVADGHSGLHLIDVADPMRPAPPVGGIGTNGGAYSVAVAGNIAYVADRDWGLRAVDISDPANPVSESSWYAQTPGWADAVAVSGDYAYVADRSGGLRVFDISDIRPLPAGQCPTPINAYGVDVDGNYAYAVTFDSKLQVVDISNPTEPAVEGTYDGTGRWHDVAVAGNYAYVASGGGLRVINIQNPDSPGPEHQCPDNRASYGVAVEGDHAYMAAGIYGLRIINVKDKENMFVEGEIDTDGVAYAVAVSGNYAFLASRYPGLHVIDISIPWNPRLVGTCDTPGGPNGVVIDGDYAYVADFTEGLQVIGVFQNLFDGERNTAQSLDYEPSDDGQVVRVKLTPSQTDYVDWWLSANGGANWQEYLPTNPDGFVRMSQRGQDLRWLSQHFYGGDDVNPECSNLVIDWLREPARILSIDDIPEDQGGEVSVRFARSGLDFEDEVEEPIEIYEIWRCAEGHAMKSAISAVSGHAGKEVDHLDGIWEMLGEIPAAHQEQYTFEASTLGDSTETGVIHTVFCVVAQTAIPSVSYASLPDSGYSIDNLSPGVPTGFVVDYDTPDGILLRWNPSSDEDFDCFRVYRDDAEDFDPSDENLIHETVETTWTDADGTSLHYYKLSALDHAGNESAPASPVDILGVEQTGPSELKLGRSIPNPASGRISISFHVPVGVERSRLRVFDVSGRLVCTLIDGEEGPCSKMMEWDGTDDEGDRVVAGTYYFRLEADGRVLTRKSILIE